MVHARPLSRSAALAVALLLSASTGCTVTAGERYDCGPGGCESCDGYGCSPVEAPAKAACTSDRSCEVGAVCTSLGCAVPCASSDACPRGEVCTDGTCQAPGAAGVARVECSTREECGASATCAEHRCVACGGDLGPCPCTSADECEGGSACVAGSCIPGGDACTFGSECGEGRSCVDGACYAECKDGACDGGAVCKGGACIPEPAAAACSASTPCADEGATCVAGACVAKCGGQVEGECGDGRYCVDGACILDTRPKTNCTIDEDCNVTSGGPARRCLGGFCKYRCSDDTACRRIDARIGYCADDRVCRSDIEAHAECFGPAECDGGRSCVDNRCR